MLIARIINCISTKTNLGAILWDKEELSRSDWGVRKQWLRSSKIKRSFQLYSIILYLFYFSLLFVARKGSKSARHAGKTVRRLFVHELQATSLSQAAFVSDAFPSLAGCCETWFARLYKKFIPAQIFRHSRTMACNRRGIRCVFQRWRCFAFGEKFPFVKGDA